MGIKLSKEHIKKIGDANRKNTKQENYKMKQARWKSKNIQAYSKCQICKSIKKLQKHHWNYEKPLMVNTLCSTCHSIQHVKDFKTSKYGGNL